MYRFKQNKMIMSETFPRTKLWVKIIGITTHSKYRPKFNMMLNPFSINPPDYKVDITHNKAMKTMNLVDIFCTNEYNNSQVPTLSIPM